MNWQRLLELAPEDFVISVAVLATMIAVGLYVIGKIRPKPVQRELPASELLSKFKEIHSRGGLTDAEFRTIKTTLAVRLHEQLKDDGKTA